MENMNTFHRVNFDDARAYIENERARSAWDRGLKAYAADMLDELEENVIAGYIAPDELTDWRTLRAALLNGAKDWSQYSWGGCALIYDADIAERLCNPSELRKTRNGQRRPNAREEWLDTQARALFQAANMVHRAIEAATVTISETIPEPVQHDATQIATA